MHINSFGWKILIYLPLEFSTINIGQSWPRLTLIQPSSFRWFWMYLRNYITSSVNISVCNFKTDNPLLLFSHPVGSDSLQPQRLQHASVCVISFCHLIWFRRFSWQGYGGSFAILSSSGSRLVRTLHYDMCILGGPTQHGSQLHWVTQAPSPRQGSDLWGEELINFTIILVFDVKF